MFSSYFLNCKLCYSFISLFFWNSKLTMADWRSSGLSPNPQSAGQPPLRGSEQRPTTILGTTKCFFFKFCFPVYFLKQQTLLHFYQFIFFGTANLQWQIGDLPGLAQIPNLPANGHSGGVSNGPQPYLEPPNVFLKLCFQFIFENSKLCYIFISLFFWNSKLTMADWRSSGLSPNPQSAGQPPLRGSEQRPTTILGTTKCFFFNFVFRCIF